MTDLDPEALSRTSPPEKAEGSEPVPAMPPDRPQGHQSWHWKRPDPFGTLAKKLPLQIFMRDQVGLDLGSKWVKYAVTRHGIGSPRVIAAGGVPVEAKGRGEMGKIKGQIAALLSIREHVPRKTEQWVIGIGGPGTMVRTIEVPQLPRKELKTAVLWKAQKVFPFPLEDAYVAVTYARKKSNGPVEAIVSAATKRMVDDVLFLLTEAEIKPSAVTLPAFGLGGLLNDAGYRNPDEYYGLLDIGYQTSLMAVFHSGALVFFREIDLGTSEIESSIAQETTLLQSRGGADTELIEQIMFERGMQESKDDTGHGSRATASMGTAFEKILMELQSTLEYYSAQSSGLKINKFLLLGGGANIPGLDVHLQTFLETPVELHSSVSHMPQTHTDSEYAPIASPSWATAFGYSLLSRKLPNLLPPAYLNEQEAKFRRMLWRTSTGTAVAVSVMLAGAELIRGDRAADRLADMNRQVIQTDQRLAEMGLANIDGTLAASRKWMTAVSRMDINTASLLRTIAAVTSERIIIDHLDIRPIDSGWAHVVLTGEVRTGHDQNEVTLAAFIERLENTHWLTHISLSHYSTLRRPEYEQIMFTITLRAPLMGSRL